MPEDEEEDVYSDEEDDEGYGSEEFDDEEYDDEDEEDEEEDEEGEGGGQDHKAVLRQFYEVSGCNLLTRSSSPCFPVLTPCCAAFSLCHILSPPTTPT